MAGYRDKLKRLNADYRRTEAAKPSSFNNLPQGTYQFEIKSVKLVPESKATFAKGELELQIYPAVLTGEFKGSMGRMNFFLEQPAKKVGDREIPSGLATFKGFIEGMGVSLPDLTEKSLQAALRELKGMKFVGYCNGKYNTIYFNSALETADLDIEDEEFEEAEEDETEDTSDSESDSEGASDDDEPEEEEDEGPPPPKKARTIKPEQQKKSKAKPKSAEGETSEDEEFDFDEF
jgi:hypothetical protein